MKRVQHSLLSLLALAMMLLPMLTACEKTKEENEEQRGNILLAATVKNPDGMSGSTYLRLVPELTGSLSLDKGIQIDFGSSLGFLDNAVYVFPGDGPNTKQMVEKYSFTDSKLQQDGTLPVPPKAYASNIARVQGDKAYMGMFYRGMLGIVDLKNFKRTGEINLAEYAHGAQDNSPDPSIGILRDGLYYQSLSQINSDYMPYPDHQQVDVAIIDPATDRVKKIISSDPNQGFCFGPRPMLPGMVFMDEAKDIYIACTGYFGMNPVNISNGFVCIPAGREEFDASRAWDISTTTIEGFGVPSVSVFNTLYLGNGKVIAQVALQGLIDPDHPYTTRSMGVVMIDLKAKSIKRIEGIPVSDPFCLGLALHNGKVYVAANGETESGIYEVDPQSGSAKRVMETAANVGYIYFF